MDEGGEVAHRARVEAAWLDYNGHLNEAYYLVIFSHATDVLLDRIEMDAAVRERDAVSVFTLETHLTYLREVAGGESVEVRIRVLGLDAKRMHLFSTMRRDGSEEPCATAEMVLLHVDMRTRRGAPFRPATLAALKALHEAQGRTPWPAQAGRSVGLKRS